MKKIVLTFGILAGLICGGMFFILAPADGKMDFSQGALYGYITMVIALSTIFFAIKQYRDKYNEGEIKFGKAFLIGLYITLVAGVIYVLTWEIYFTNYMPDFGEQYVDYLQSQMVESGVEPAEIESKIGEQRQMMETYSTNMPMRMGMTLMEILPVGLIISLISAFFFSYKFTKKDALA